MHASSIRWPPLPRSAASAPPVRGAARLTLSLALWLITGTASATPGDGPQVSRLTALAPVVEQAAARTRPATWPLKRACLYYALAGQYLLARAGIDTTLHIGTVIYDPQTPAAHRISPHAWLETAHHFVDYATLPRRGQVTVIGLGQVAADEADVMPGQTRVLALGEPDNPQLHAYVAVHRARFLRLMLQPPGHWPTVAPTAGRGPAADACHVPGRR